MKFTNQYSLLIFFIFIYFCSCGKSKKTDKNIKIEEFNESHSSYNFSQIIKSIPQLDLPLTFLCGAENYKWALDYGDSIAKISPNDDAIVGKLPSKGEHHFIVTGKVGDIIYPHLLVFDNESNRTDSLYLHIGYCAGDGEQRQTTKTIINEDYSILMIDTLWHYYYVENTPTEIYDSIYITKKILTLQDDYKYTIDEQDTLIFRNKIIHTPIDTLLGEYHVQYFIKENGNIISREAYIDKQGYTYLNYLDNSIYLTLKKGDTTILYSHKITRKDFESIIPEKEMKDYQVWNMWIKDYSSNQIRFSCNVCIPDTDICYLVAISIDDKGNMSYEEEEINYEE